MRRAPARLRFACVLGAAAAVVGGCGPRRAASLVEDVQRADERLASRAKETFHNAAFCKPGETAPEGFKLVLAPLIVQQIEDTGGTPTTASRAAQTGPGFGRLVRNLRGAYSVDAKKPTVYVADSTATIEGIEFHQLAYTWYYPPKEGGTEPVAQGVRMTFDLDGYPILWEALTDSGGERLVFVSQDVEDHAQAAFGTRCAGRSFFTERSIAQSPHVVVPRVIDEGPMPMGPFVYLTAGRHDVSTVLCRCMASQADRFVRTVEFDLEPADTIDASMVSDGWSNHDGGALNRMLRFANPP